MLKMSKRHPNLKKKISTKTKDTPRYLTGSVLITPVYVALWSLLNRLPQAGVWSRLIRMVLSKHAVAFVKAIKIKPS